MFDCFILQVQVEELEDVINYNDLFEDPRYTYEEGDC